MKTKGGKVTTKVDSVKKLNPFELKYNRAKHKIMGTKTVFTPCGAPGLSRKRAFENRAKTLAVEWKERGKRNKVVDHRCGNGNIKIADEECMLKRFTAERLKLFQTDKPHITDSGAQEELLTHRGRVLTEVEKYDRTMLSEEEDDEEGNISADVVASAHFGGGATSMAESATNKRQNILAELIAKSKQQRLDKKMARYEHEDATEILDEKWKELQQTGAMISFARLPENASVTKSKSDDYDVLLFELQADSGKRGEANERKKTDKELAYEECEKLIKQEKSRLMHMKQNDRGKRKAKDDDIKKKEGFVVRYDGSGALIDSEKVERGRIKMAKFNSDSSDEENASAINKVNEAEDDFDMMVQDDGDDSVISNLKNVETGEQDRSENELPYVIDMPLKYASLKILLDAHIGPNCELIILRLIKLNHPSLCEGNKSKLNRLFILLLRYYDDLSKERQINLDAFSYIARGLYALMKFSVEYSVRCMRALLLQQQKLHFWAPRSMFSFRVVAFLKLVTSLYPLTDVFHPVVGPTLTFACSFISTVRICSIKDAARVLLLLKILALFVEDSKRYIPEIMAFLHGVFLTAVENKDSERSPLPTFPTSLPHRRMLYVTNECSATEMSSQLGTEQIFSDSFEESDENKLRVLIVAVNVLCQFSVIYSNNVNFTIIFRPLLNLLLRLPDGRYPKQLLDELYVVKTFINAQFSKNSLRHLQRAVKEKRMLTTLEPRFEENFAAEKAQYQKTNARKSMKRETKYLTKKYKKELRGTVRELRRDNQFLNREKKKEILESDLARRQKMKWLISTLQGQESEYKKNAFMKQRKK